MNIGGILIDFDPTQSFEQKRVGAGLHSPNADERHDAREHAVKQFKKNAIQATQEQIVKPATACLALLIQLRSLGGSFSDNPGGARLKDQLKEMVEFMEDM